MATRPAFWPATSSTTVSPPPPPSPAASSSCAGAGACTRSRRSECGLPSSGSGGGRPRRSGGLGVLVEVSLPEGHHDVGEQPAVIDCREEEPLELPVVVAHQVDDGVLVDV